MTAEHPSPERLILFSDAVFAIIVTCDLTLSSPAS
jgi:uncharacterized membrane protein